MRIAAKLLTSCVLSGSILSGVILMVTALAAPAWAEANGRGEDLFDLCTQCHGSAGEGKHNIEAPAIAGLPAWYVTTQLKNFKSGARATHFDDIQGMRMRPMAMSLTREGDVEAVAGYVASLPIIYPASTLDGGDAAKGQGLYMLCASCHAIDGTGSEPQGGPPLAGQSDWYILTQLEKYKAGIRGRDPRDAFGLMMQPMSLTLADEQAMKDVIAHIMTLKPAN